MVAQATCPDPDVIHDLLCGKLPEAEHGELSSHFDLCSDCRQRFEDEASLPEFLGDVSRMCSNPEWQQESATLGRLMQDMPQQLSTAADAASVVTWSTEAVAEFFDPSDDPDHIGRLGSYEVIEVIGRGGMGIVLRGIDTKLNRVVAIKVLAPELASNPNARRRFFREGQAAAAVSHDHVVTIHAVDDSERLPYLVMEFVEGESLEECVRRTGSLPIEQILRIGRQTALGLAAAHEVGLVHRDMKPANILLENGIQRVRITDFGLARAVDDVGMTQTGTVSGTPLYMSPEQAGGENVDHRSDLFSLGSVLYTMCTGRPAFRANSTVAVLKRVCEDTPRSIREVNPDVPEWLVKIIGRLMSKQPDARLQTAAEVADLLGGHLAHLQDPNNVPAPASVVAAEPEPRTSSRPRRLLMLAALLSFVTFGISDAVGLTAVGESFMGIILKLTTKDGTLVVEIEDPNVEVAVDGDELVVKGVGKHEIRLKPGKHQFTEIREGVAARQEWVTIESGGKRVLRVMQLPPNAATAKIGDLPPAVSALAEPRTDDDVNFRPSVDGIAFETNVRLQRLVSQEVIVAPGVGKLIFPEVPEQLFGQRCAMARVDRQSLRFQAQNRTFGNDPFQWVARHGGSARQRLWLLVPESDWGPQPFHDPFPYDTRESLAKRSWHAWRTLTSYHATTDPKDEANHVKWAVFYRDADPNESFSIRTNATHTPMLVWGSLLMDDILLDIQWDQRVSVFNPGASVSLGNGHHIFDEVPEFLAGRLYTKRNGYQGFVRFRAERDQRIVVGMYDWRAMNDGNASGGWQKELTPPDRLKETGWKEVATLTPRHSHASGGATWHFYARDCKRGETFMLRSHKYQAPIVFSERPAGRNAPAPEGVEFRLPTATEIERRIAKYVVDYNRLFKERRFAEAVVVAKQALELDPGNAVCITMMLQARHAVRLYSGETHPQEATSSPKTTPAGAAIELDPAHITVGIAPAVGEPAVYGVGSPVTPLREFRVFFEARAQGRHPDGARKLIGQIPGPIQPGDAISVERFERTGGLLRLYIRHEAGPQRKSDSRAEHSIENINPLDEARRLSVVYEKARIDHPDDKKVKHWLLLIARHMIARADMEPDQNEVRKLREQARERVLNARKLFEADAASARTKHDAFPAFTDPKANPELHSEKTRVEIDYITAQLQVARCRLVDALSLQLLTEERADRLRAVADEFETLYQKYRTRLGGVYARVEQARCLQFLGRPEDALAIYGEVLAYPGNSDSMLRVQNRALLFSLASLSDEHEDSDGVMRRASEWLAKAPVEHQRSLVGAGILWEEAAAMRGRRETTPTRLVPELMGDDGGELILRATLQLLRQVERSGGQHSARAAQRIKDVLALLDNNGEAVPGDAINVSPARAAEEPARNSRGDGDPLESARDLTQRYENFLAENPDHKDVSRTLMSFARNLMAQAALENEADVVPGLLSQARQRCAAARTLFDAEFAGAKAKFESFPVLIDREKDPKLLAQRQNAEVEFISAQLQLATCTFVESLTHSKGSDQRTRKLTNAAAAFEKLHEKYRTHVGGLYGRLWQGRCLQLLGDHGAALGIFDELLDHRGESGSLRDLHNHAVYFRLISLNDDSQRDWQLVLDESRLWVGDTTKAERDSNIGFGVMWEISRAMLGASGDRTVARKILASLGAERGIDVRTQLNALALEMQNELRDKHPRLEVVVRGGFAGAENPPTAVDAGDPPSHSLYFQARLPSLPPGEYQVEATLRSFLPTQDSSDPVEKPAITVSGAFTVPGSYDTAQQLRRLATQAIVMPVSADRVGLVSATQSPHGLDLTAILASTDQQALVASFPAENAQFEEACALLRTKGMKWALCEILNHPNVDAKIYATRELARMADADTVAVLLAAAKRNDYDVNGSESATIHSIYRQALKKALEATTGLKLTPDGLSYITIQNGESVRVSSRNSPEVFPENVDFARVEEWLRNVYLPGSEAQINPLSFDRGEAGLFGRATVDGKDAGTIFHYSNGRFFVHEDIPAQMHDSNGFVVKLEGYVVVPQDMIVKVWHGGGGVSHDVNTLFINGQQVSAVGDDRSKHFVDEIPFLKGLHHVRWELTGGTFRTNILVFLDPKSGELMNFLNTGEANIRKSPEEPLIRIKGTELGWPILDRDWLPGAVEVTEPAPDDTPGDEESTDATPASTPPKTGEASASTAQPRTDPIRGAIQFISRLEELGGSVDSDGFGNIIRLNLDGIKVQDEDLANLKAFPKLANIDLARTQITDAGLAHLSGLTNLTDLRFYDTKVGDPGIAHLHGLKKLTIVMLKRSHVTDVGAGKLKAALPDCLVSHSPRTITTPNGMRLAPIPAGAFTMGSPASEAGRPEGDREKQHQVRITRPFYMGVHEVTQEQYAAVMGTNPSEFSPSGDARNEITGIDTANFPVENVSWSNATEFCKRLSAMPQEREAGRTYRLPTEAEWEWACRAGTEAAYQFGDAVNASQANYFSRDDAVSMAEPAPFVGRTAKVGSYRPNGFGLYDMHGNVWELCNDPFDAGYYSDSPTDDPPGAEFGLRTDTYVRRGGSWRAAAPEMRAANRSNLEFIQSSADTGFRVICYED